ncbi:MAG: amidohydrolase family protein [Verrucomicrobia bacterium]|nr:amidohydrolase family protein [Verrucomicrobiota bacterium]MBI3867103.1 amidohydrolase family protein [Verrucomicrobiota bacterium]
MLLRSRIVYPVATPPIDNGAVWIVDGRIRAIGSFPDLASHIAEPVVDLDDSILMPGLVNAHCHLDYTGFAGQIPPPLGFTHWVQQLITLKSQWSYTDFAESWLLGMRQLAQGGVTTVGDIEAVPELLPEVLPGAPIRVVSFRELITIRSRARGLEILDAAIDELEKTNRGPHRLGLSPHAPYTTSQELARESARRSREKGWKWTIHVGESSEEFEMFRHKRGAMHEWLRSQRDMSDCGVGTPFAWLADTGELDASCLIVHANCLEPGEIERLAASGASVAHCPRSHGYFRHPRFSADAMKRAGVNVCLGTDSLASALAHRGGPPRLDMFSEMRAFMQAHPDFAPAEVLEMATARGAKALGLELETGALRPGLSADLAVVPWSGALEDAASALTQHSGEVRAAMCFGRWTVGPEIQR